jgi:N-acetylmuramoyl-L-alanine amidase
LDTAVLCYDATEVYKPVRFGIPSSLIASVILFSSLALYPALLHPVGENLPQTSPESQGATRTIVLDAPHGGSDPGARWPGGVTEKELVLNLTAAVAQRLQGSGYRVMLTRHSDVDLSFDERAALANGTPHAVFVTLHVGSAPPDGSVFVFYYSFGQIADAPATLTGLTLWTEAQRQWAGYSQRLAQLLQAEFQRTLQASPELPTAAAIYQLRLIAAPAVAVEIETRRPEIVPGLVGTISETLVRSLQAFQSFLSQPPPS